MPVSSLKKLVLPPVVLSAAVFAALTLPLAVLGSKPVTIQFQEEPIFHGQLRDVATPYLGLTSALSLGAGLASVAITGWRSSTRKSSQVEAKLSDLTQNLREKEAQLEALKISESRLESSGLSAFLDEQATAEPVQIPPATSIEPQPELQPEPQPERQPVVEPLVIRNQPLEAQPIAQSQLTGQSAAARFASAQIFLGYAQTKATLKPASTETPLAPLQAKELYTQLEQIRSQMATLQEVLSATSPASPLSEEKNSVDSDAAIPTSPRLQVVKSWSVHKMTS
jgi:hypothetical protein